MYEFLFSAWPRAEPIPVMFIFLTFYFLLLAFAAWSTGAAMANSWQSVKMTAFYTLMLGAAHRFLMFGLFDGTLLSVAGYFFDTILMLIVVGLAYRFNQVRLLAAQYPWIYRRTSPFTYGDRH